MIFILVPSLRWAVIVMLGVVLIITVVVVVHFSHLIVQAPFLKPSIILYRLLEHSTTVTRGWFPLSMAMANPGWNISIIRITLSSSFGTKCRQSHANWLNFLMASFTVIVPCFRLLNSCCWAFIALMLKNFLLNSPTKSAQVISLTFPLITTASYQ